eukprot:12983601-Alexandrium_andersonii.AAC.1
MSAADAAAATRLRARFRGAADDDDDEANSEEGGWRRDRAPRRGRGVGVGHAAKVPLVPGRILP